MKPFEGRAPSGAKSLRDRVLGRFYTPKCIADSLAERLLRYRLSSRLAVIDPFCGDGRLVIALLEKARALGFDRNIVWNVSLWDWDGQAVEIARERVATVAKALSCQITINSRHGDSFACEPQELCSYDIVITNPPWETLKPDARELASLSSERQASYRERVRAYDRQLRERYPEASPTAEAFHPAANLARVGATLAARLVKPNGRMGVVLPGSLLSDRISREWRTWFFEGGHVDEIYYYPAESRLFQGVDQPVAVLTWQAVTKKQEVVVQRFTASNCSHATQRVVIPSAFLKKSGFAIPDAGSVTAVRILEGFSSLPTLRQIEGNPASGLRLGREIDETRLEEKLSDRGAIGFVKGRMVSRFQVTLNGHLKYLRSDVRVPESVKYWRVVWRDVSRRSQVRRVHAASLGPGLVTGNSLNVAYFRNHDENAHWALLGLLNSLTFEFQIRARLGTGHVSVGSMREIHVPPFISTAPGRHLATLSRQISEGRSDLISSLEVAAAAAYCIDRDEFASLVDEYPKLPEREKVLDHKLWEDIAGLVPIRRLLDVSFKGIPNHYSAKLSDVDLQIAAAVQPGQNWKAVPEHVPCKRIELIRQQFKAGLGSRSTYYGRLHPDRPAYTINTYFNRPGNGCHLHYDYDGSQHRTLSQREAARLQSFPDDFVFLGNKSQIFDQIGNAVPPLLAYQVARQLGRPGAFVDLFCGAGGLGLGFKWAGWQPIIGNDIDKAAVATYKANVHSNASVGDIRSRDVFEALVSDVRAYRKANPSQLLIVLGGPPCQGFSTAGKRRSMEDERNTLFYEYKRFLEAVGADAFLFENVTGLLNMEGGRVFALVRKELQSNTRKLIPWILSAEQYGIPQRRTRVILLGWPSSSPTPQAPEIVTSINGEATLLSSPRRVAVSVREALSDLPPLTHGEDGSGKDYSLSSQNAYQRLMRGDTQPSEYLAEFDIP